MRKKGEGDGVRMRKNSGEGEESMEKCYFILGT